MDNGNGQDNTIIEEEFGISTESYFETMGDLSEAEAQERINDLVARLATLAESYYDSDDPVASDAEYDGLMAALSGLEELFPNLAILDSPTQNVGGKASELFSKIEHSKKMLSLQNAYSMHDLDNFDTRISKDATGCSYTVEEKYDGLTLVIRFKQGKLENVATRGDGQVGEDVTANFSMAQLLPGELAEPVDIAVRAEAFLPVKEFQRLNSERAAAGLKLFANPRNAAAGSVRQLDAQASSLRGLDYVVFSVESETSHATHSGQLAYASSLGLKTGYIGKAATMADAKTLVGQIGERRDALGYEIDGAVVKVDEIWARQEIGETSKFPKWAIAYKFTADSVLTKLLGVTIQVGRTGVLTPVAELSPVFISGSLVARATLHNEDYIKSKDIRIGDTVKVSKAGDVIPEVSGPEISARTGQEVEFEFPTTCPICGYEAARENGGAYRKCLNPYCPQKLERAIAHFASKGAADIRGLGRALVARFYSEGLVRDIADIYKLKGKTDQLQELKNFGQTSISNLLGAIEASKGMPFSSFIYALGIPLIGHNAAKIIASHYQGPAQLKNASLEDLAKIDGFGMASAMSIKSFIDGEAQWGVVDELLELGVSPAVEAKEKRGDLFKGKTFVITGTLPTYSRNEAAALIASHNGRVAGSVSSKTDYVLAGENAGGKLAKAESLGIRIISENELVEMLGLLES
ncbi:MAG: NAD-dependent DNA ligase LigA [Eubacteriaceae bacterium]|nr:NAD-dependent DNA ligase LigA [Eubacteriaceae bacterium]